MVDTGKHLLEDLFDGGDVLVGDVAILKGLLAGVSIQTWEVIPGLVDNGASVIQTTDCGLIS